MQSQARHFKEVTLINLRCDSSKIPRAEPTEENRSTYDDTEAEPNKDKETENAGYQSDPDQTPFTQHHHSSDEDSEKVRKLVIRITNIKHQ